MYLTPGQHPLNYRREDIYSQQQIEILSSLDITYISSLEKVQIF
jgi:hypothetical protein